MSVCIRAPRLARMGRQLRKMLGDPVDPIRPVDRPASFHERQDVVEILGAACFQLEENHRQRCRDASPQPIVVDRRAERRADRMPPSHDHVVLDGSWPDDRTGERVVPVSLADLYLCAGPEVRLERIGDSTRVFEVRASAKWCSVSSSQVPVTSPGSSQPAAAVCHTRRAGKEAEVRMADAICDRLIHNAVRAEGSSPTTGDTTTDK